MLLPGTSIVDSAQDARTAASRSRWQNAYPRTVGADERGCIAQMKVQAQMGRRRTDDDGCRRYLPIALTFDTRAYILNTKIEDDWEEDSRQQWTRNQRLMREALLHEYGAQDGERKIGDFAAMDAAPWSVVGPHNEVVTDIRRAFAAGSYYSALLGAAGLGERILNDLVLRLRTDYAGHPSTGNVAQKKSFNDWNVMTQTLRGWGVLDEGSARSCACEVR